MHISVHMCVYMYTHLSIRMCVSVMCMYLQCTHIIQTHTATSSVRPHPGGPICGTQGTGSLGPWVPGSLSFNPPKCRTVPPSDWCWVGHWQQKCCTLAVGPPWVGPPKCPAFPLHVCPSDPGRGLSGAFLLWTAFRPQQRGQPAPRRVPAVAVQQAAKPRPVAGGGGQWDVCGGQVPME